MKKSAVFMLIALSFCFLLSCSIDPTVNDALSDTYWESGNIIVGKQLEFTSASEGTFTAKTLVGTIGPVSFDYTYSPTTLSGQIYLSVSMTGTETAFTVSADGKKLSWDNSEYACMTLQ